MNYKKTLILAILLMIFFRSVTVFAESEKAISRNILMDVQWDDKNSYVVAKYIQIWKVEGQNFVVRDRQFILDGAINPGFNGTRAELIQKLKKDFYSDIYKQDKIFGQRVEIFADLSQKVVPHSEVQNVVQDTKKSIMEDFKNPPKIKSDQSEISGSFIIYAVIIGFIILFIKDLKKA